MFRIFPYGKFRHAGVSACSRQRGRRLPQTFRNNSLHDYRNRENQLRLRLRAPALDQALASSQSMTRSRRAIARLFERPNIVIPRSTSSRFDLVRRLGDAEMFSISNFMKPISPGVRPNGGTTPVRRSTAVRLCDCPNARWPIAGDPVIRLWATR
jgi:hypothetical protein